VLGTFGDTSQGVSDLCDLAADALAHEHLQLYDGIPGQVNAMYTHQTRRRWGHTAMRGWAKLVIDRRCLEKPQEAGTRRGQHHRRQWIKIQTKLARLLISISRTQARVRDEF
jgi:hypothetical protein